MSSTVPTPDEPVTVPTPDLPVYLSRKEVAALLRVTVTTVDNLVARGDLELVRFAPRIVRIPLSSIEALAAKGSK